MARIPDDISLETWIKQLVKLNKLYLFYKSDDWLELRNDVLKDAHNECQHCLMDGIYTRATMVHHINEVRKRPDMALTKEYVDTITGEKKQNLVALCHDCHEKEHDRLEGFINKNGVERFSNVERW